MSVYVLVDANNMFHRSKHVSSGDITIKIGLALHVTLNAMKSMWKKFGGGHIVVCLEGSSWRKAVYPSYKAHRKVQADLRTSKEKEDDALLFEAFNEFCEFLKKQTNVTVLQSKGIEADDWIARWIQTHPEDQHVIISNDSDFIQLLSPNVTLYNAVEERTVTPEAVYDSRDRKLEFSVTNSGKLKIGKPNDNFIPPKDWWKHALFTKCLRGDAGDGVMSAYPGVRQTRINEAYEDMNSRGFLWNKVMLHTFTDHNGDEIKVLDAYKRNVQLIDLTQQPDEIKELMDMIILEETKKTPNSGVGIWFLRFCNKMSLINISKNPNDYSQMLSVPYRRSKD